MAKRVRLETKSSIFGAGLDVVSFLAIPVVIAAVLTALFGPSPGLVASAILFVLFDHFHVYTGIGIALVFPEQWKGRELFYLGFPVLCFAVYSGLFALSAEVFALVYAYASIFHFSRQQVGWMRATGRRGTSFASWESALDDLAIYFATFGFVAYRVFDRPGATWFVEGDLGFASFLPSNLILGLVLAVNAAYLIRQFVVAIKHRYVNLSKNLIWFSTFLVWGLSFAAFKTVTVAAIALIVVHHAAPFIMLSFFYVRHRRREGRRSYFGPLAFVTIAVAALILSSMEQAVLAEWSLFNYFSSLRFLEPFLATIATYHYAIDSFFWRQAYNPGCLSFAKTVSVATDDLAQVSDSVRRKSS